MYCCAHVTCHCQYGNAIQFSALKMKYRIDEDIALDYTVQDRSRTSTRDWIGIFPREWIYLQQYLTFEYVVVSPKTSVLSNRSLMFLHTFNREASPNVDYQFVYVSKEEQILGTSSYFRFAVPPGIHPLDRNVNPPDCGAVKVANPTPIVSPVPNIAVKMVASSKSSDNLVQSNRTEHSFADQKTCRVCSKSRSFMTNRVQFLLLHNEQLVARLSRLARDLELAQSAVEIEITERAALTKKLKTYEIFVTDLFKYLNFMGIVKIVDEDAKEIIVQKLKYKQLASTCDGQGDKPVVTLEHPTKERCTNTKRSNDEGRTKISRPIKVSQKSSTFESNEDVEAVVEHVEEDTELSANKNEKNSVVIDLVETKQLPFYKSTSLAETKITNNRENLSGSHVTKEATSTTNERDDNACKVICKIEQANCVKGKQEDTKSVVDNDKKTIGNLDALETVDSSKCSRLERVNEGVRERGKASLTDIMSSLRRPPKHRRGISSYCQTARQPGKTKP